MCWYISNICSSSGYKAFYSSFDISDFIIENDKFDFIEKIVGDTVMGLDLKDEILVVDDGANEYGIDLCKEYFDIIQNKLGFNNASKAIVQQDKDGPSYKDMIP
ncbi:hypothetical protein [Lutispora sp.]|uniref:hypothetical protein n=1 Tax=Lutispora sp. TaxID=2828727 RepID=UPI002B21601B|nr:hypothetical protein [Lutispora sp.]MEA4961600.1 hypothetical protein [Lutispora sp.]